MFAEPILNVRRASGTLAFTGYSHLAARRLGVPLDAMLDLLLAHGYCRIKHPIDGEYWVTFRSAQCFDTLNVEHNCEHP